MTLLLITFIPLLILLIWGKQLSQNKHNALKLLSLPFIVLVAFYSFLIALGILLAFFIYIKFIMPRIAEDEYPRIRWDQ